MEKMKRRRRRWWYGEERLRPESVPSCEAPQQSLVVFNFQFVF
jgi:hypothetical protein